MPEFSHDPNLKLRIIVDESLSPGQQIAQSLHAAIEYIYQHPEDSLFWHNYSNSVIILSTNIDNINALIQKCALEKIDYSCFHEPGLDNRLTAICIEPCIESRRLTSNFRLALKDYQGKVNNGNIA
jgi:hypothetical protein